MSLSHVLKFCFLHSNTLNFNIKFIDNIAKFYFIFCSIQFLNCPTLAKTVKASLMSHLGDPQLTAPCNVHEPLLFWQTNGPPESPWQPDWLAETSVFAAHNIWSVIGAYFPFMREQVDYLGWSKQVVEEWCVSILDVWSFPILKLIWTNLVDK